MGITDSLSIESDDPGVLISAEALRDRVLSLGSALTARYVNRRPIFVTVLKGAMIFAADLVRGVPIEVELEFIHASSYGMGAQSDGTIEVIPSWTRPLTGRDVVIIEDIVDTGVTLHCIRAHIESQRPATIEACALLDKPGRRRVEVPLEYVGFEIEDVFAVGYGLDYAERFRNLPYIGVVNT